MFLYVGKLGVETDTNSLIYMRARYYNPEINQFINEDPIKDGLNWYGYVNGNPISFVDPEGLISHNLQSDSGGGRGLFEVNAGVKTGTFESNGYQYHYVEFISQATKYKVEHGKYNISQAHKNEKLLMQVNYGFFARGGVSETYGITYANGVYKHDVIGRHDLTARNHNNNADFLILYSDGSSEIVKYTTLVKSEENLKEGNYNNKKIELILSGGDIDYGNTARTAIGTKSNGNVVILVGAKVDKNGGSAIKGYGPNIGDMHQELKDLHVLNSLILDGGGSTQLYLEGQFTFTNWQDRTIESVINIYK